MYLCFERFFPLSSFYFSPSILSACGKGTECWWARLISSQVIIMGTKHWLCFSGKFAGWTDFKSTVKASIWYALIAGASTIQLLSALKTVQAGTYYSTDCTKMISCTLFLASIFTISAALYSNNTGLNVHVEWYSGDMHCWTKSSIITIQCESFHN